MVFVPVTLMQQQGSQ